MVTWRLASTTLAAMIRVIDTHVHFWELAGYGGYDGWFAGREYLRRDYLPHHLRPELAAVGAEGAVIVGAAPDSHRHNLEWGADVRAARPTCSAWWAATA